MLNLRDKKCLNGISKFTIRLNLSCSDTLIKNSILKTEILFCLINLIVIFICESLKFCRAFCSLLLPHCVAVFCVIFVIAALLDSLAIF